MTDNGLKLPIIDVLLQNRTQIQIFGGRTCAMAGESPGSNVGRYAHHSDIYVA